MGRCGQGRIPALVHDARRSRRFLRRCTPDLPRGARWTARILVPTEWPGDALALHLGEEGPSRAARIPASCVGDPSHVAASGARLRPRPATRTTPGGARGDPALPRLTWA